MSKRWIGITNTRDKVTVVDAIIEKHGPVEIESDHTWSLQKGDRPNAYDVIYRQLLDYAKEHKVDRIVIKGTALSTQGVKKAHLEAAELRGVLQAAAAASTGVSIRQKAQISRNFGSRKADEYLSDNDFWSENTVGDPLRAGSREAALLLIAERDEEL